MVTLRQQSETAAPSCDVEIPDAPSTVHDLGYNRCHLANRSRSPVTMALSFTLPDQGRRSWVLADHLDPGVVIVTLRGDW
jgi:hypothetical protein